MADIDELSLKSALEELEKLITTRVVVGERIEVANHTVIPLCSVGFGFGAGRGDSHRTSQTGVAEKPKRDDERGSGLAVGGGVRPVAVIVAGPEGVKVHPLGPEAGLSLERLAKLLTGKGDKETTE